MRLFAMAAAIVFLAAFVFVAPALAHDGQIGTSDIPIEFSGTGSGVAQTSSHIDADPWKGLMTIYAYNSSDVAWGDFHIQLFSIGQSVANVDFVDTGGHQPTSSQGTLTWTINNAPATGATIDLYYANHVDPGHLASFTVYTDNTVDHVNFGVSFWPTPVVPEPSSVMALSSGLIGLAGFALRRRR
jgi:hypothetical protein